MISTRVRLATFNIHHGRGRDGKVDIERTARVIEQLKCELVALQEVDRGLERSGRIDQPKTLAELTGYHPSFHPTLEFKGGEYGLALLTREATATSAEPLPRLRDEEQRIVVSGHWLGLEIVTTHLSRSRAARSLQLDALTAMVRQRAGHVLLLGDLNAPLSELGPLLGAGLHSTSQPWWSRLRSSRSIDHILAGHEISILRSKRVPTIASDHFPLVADAEIRRER